MIPDNEFIAWRFGIARLRRYPHWVGVWVWDISGSTCIVSKVANSI